MVDLKFILESDLLFKKYHKCVNNSHSNVFLPFSHKHFFVDVCQFGQVFEGTNGSRLRFSVQSVNIVPDILFVTIHYCVP